MKTPEFIATRATLAMRVALAALCTCATLLATPAAAQVGARFRHPTLDAGWAVGGNIGLTAPNVDADGEGWLRLTPNAFNSAGIVVQNAGALSLADGLTLLVRHAAWGGGAPGADGISVFLFDAAQGAAGGALGGALGYCGAPGGWLGVALDSFGNFSPASSSCGTTGTAAAQPQAIALRGPAARGNPFVGSGRPSTPLDAASSSSRPEPSELRLHVVPAGADIFEVSVDWRRGAGAWQRVIDGAAFPYAAPAQARVAIAATTGGAKNIHEVQDLMVQPRLNPDVRLQAEPQAIRPGANTRLTVTLAEARGRRASLATPLRIELPRGVVVAARPDFGGTCLGELAAVPGGSSVLVGSGTVFNGSGCTVSVALTAREAGQFAIAVPRRAVELTSGFNTKPVSVSLTVQR